LRNQIRERNFNRKVSRDSLELELEEAQMFFVLQNAFYKKKTKKLSTFNDHDDHDVFQPASVVVHLKATK
jgi:hypothetical protein